MRLCGWRAAAKRAVDVGLAGGLLLAGAPLGLGVAACVRWRLGAPVLFAQPRAGLHGRRFILYKFRSMHSAPLAPAAPLSDAARLTPLGQALRASSLDELPQLWNVLRGDMSLVGPRPLLMHYLPRYSPTQARRHAVRPGITGWAQVNGRNALSWEQKFCLDVWYVDHWSLTLDARILLRTALRVFQRQGIQSANHATMPEFMGTMPQQQEFA